MRVCKAEFTIIDDSDSKLQRTEVVQMVFNIPKDGNMIDAMIDHLSEEKKEEEEEKMPAIITNH